MKLLVIDGNSIINRAFYAIKPLATKGGKFTNAIVGFMNIFLGALSSIEPDAVAIAFDVRQPTFRHEMFPEYKAGRKQMPPELAEQFPTLKEILTALGYCIVECPGFEADDILGTLSIAAKQNDTCYLLTGDRDSFQLISENTFVLYPSTKNGKSVSTLVDKQKIFEDYKVEPLELIDVKALMGDSSDNIPGVAGIGEKTAVSLISQYKNIDTIYENIDELKVSAGVREKLKNGRDNAFLSRKLGLINREAPINRDISGYQRKTPDTAKVQKLLSELEMFKMLEKLDLQAGTVTINNIAAAVIECNVSEVGDYHAFLKNLSAEKAAYFCVSVYENDIDALCFAYKNELIILQRGNTFDAFLKEFFENDEIEKYTDNSKAIFAYCENKSLNISNIVFDISLAGYIINPNSSDYSSATQALTYAIQLPNLNFSDPFLDMQYRKLITDSSVLPALTQALLEELTKNNQLSLLQNIEIPLAKVLADMENCGFSVDKEGIKLFGETLEKKIKDLEKNIHEYAGVEFNINSPKQLGEILFETLNLKKGKKTKTGYSTNAEVLEGLADDHPIVSEILEYRSLTKLKSTYCDGLLKVIAPDGRIHTTFNQTETRTGRISSLEPNLQNIPVRQPLGRELRRFFLAKDGYVLIDADYSQIELRVLADIADDKTMMDAFNNNDDIHTITASQVFNMPLEMVTPLMRSRAKAVNFGIVYGIGAFSLAKDIGVARYEADKYIKDYLAHYSGVNDYMQTIIEKAKEDGFVETVFHRRRYLPELAASNAIQRSFGERVARNMPIQGTAADIIKIAMINVFNRLEREIPDAKLILQVHDELIVEARETDAERVSILLKEEMENAVKLKVKLIADVHIGKTWFDTKS